MPRLGYPGAMPRTMETLGRIRNGVQPDWRVAKGVSDRANYVLCRQRKSVFAKQFGPDSLPSGLSNTHTAYYFRFRSGKASTTDGALRLKVGVLAVPPTEVGTDPSWTFSADDGGGASTFTRRVSGIIATPTISDMSYQEGYVEIDQNAEVDCEIQVTDGCRIASVCVWEEHGVHAVNTADSATTHSQLYRHDADITDFQHGDNFERAPFRIWGHNAGHLASVTPDHSNSPFARTTGSLVNLIDGASTTVNADSPGLTLQVQFWNAYHTDDVDCVIAVYGETAASTGGTVRLLDASGTLVDITNFTTTAAWHTGTFVLDGSADTHKVDLHFGGDGTNELSIHSVCLYPYTSVPY